MTSKCQNVIHIDANNQRIRMVRIPAKNNLPDLQRLVGGYIATACRMEGEHVLFVDDEGLFKPQSWFFRLRGTERPFAGNGVIVGPERYNDQGDYLGTDDVSSAWLPKVIHAVQFLNRAQVDAWAKANASDPEIYVRNLDTGETEVIAYRGKVWGDMPQPKPDMVRERECLNCGHIWTSPRRKAHTSNLSGEPTEYCPQCNSRNVMSGPAKEA